VHSLLLRQPWSKETVVYNIRQVAYSLSHLSTQEFLMTGAAGQNPQPPALFIHCPISRLWCFKQAQLSCALDKGATCNAVIFAKKTLSCRIMVSNEKRLPIRQSGIDAELFDVISGFEALTESG